MEYNAENVTKVCIVFSFLIYIRIHVKIAYHNVILICDEMRFMTLKMGIVY